jgi:2,3-bisphosphoglycerate-independent phosphoglycerate mutase
MSAYKVKERLIEELNTGKVDTVILNFANPDMVGHTGNVEAVMAACQAVDNCTGQIVNKVLELDGAVLITADHGNADLLVNPETGAPHTAHTVNPVPFILISNDLKDVKLRTDGKLADLTPTMLDLLGIEKPAEMTGETLIVK